MIYGYGGDEQPVRESLKLLSDMVVGYITRITHQGLTVAQMRGSMLNTDHLMYAFRGSRDAAKRARIEELLKMHEVIKKARSPASCRARLTSLQEREKLDNDVSNVDETVARGAATSATPGAAGATTTATAPARKRKREDGDNKQPRPRKPKPEAAVSASTIKTSS